MDVSARYVAPNHERDDSTEAVLPKSSHSGLSDSVKDLAGHKVRRPDLTTLLRNH